jgi:hypothetical protein
MANTFTKVTWVVDFSPDNIGSAPLGGCDVGRS